MVIGILSFWGYLLAVLYTPDYYSSVSSSVVFTTLNYFFWLSFVYHSFFDCFIEVPILLDEFVLFFTSQPSLKTEGALEQILCNSVKFTSQRVFCKRVLMGLLSLLTLIIYSITSYNLSEEGHKLVPTINSIYIFILDIMYLSSKYRLYLYVKYVDPRLALKHCGIIMLVYRASAAVSVNYWVLGHTVGFLVLAVVLVHSLLNILYSLT